VRLVRFAALVATCAVAAALAWLVLSSSVLALSSEDLDITTSGPAADPELVAAALQPWEGTPLARLRTAELESSVEDVPGVRSASVHRSWPNGLTVDVEARVPVVAVAVAGRHALLDVDAVQVGDRVDAVPEGIPVVSLPAGRSTEALSAVLAVLDALPPGLADEIARVSAESNDTVSFRLADGSQVRWGSAELAELKGRVLEVLRQRPAQLYDVSAPTMPVTR
jgi:cell division protein FtsQ